MQSDERESTSRITPVGGSQYTAVPATRHRGRKIRRILFFGLASAWGFMAGVCGLLVAMSAAGQVVQPSPGTIAGLIPALIVAAAGAFVVAAAYKESKRRAR